MDTLYTVAYLSLLLGLVAMLQLDPRQACAGFSKLQICEAGWNLIMELRMILHCDLPGTVTK